MTPSEAIEAEFTEGRAEGHTVASLTPVRYAGALVRPAAATAEIEAAFHAYNELYSRLLVERDFQLIAGKKFPKKSAFRKLSVAFGVDLTIKERVYERNEAGRIIRAEVVATATAPNGRHADGLGACDLFEKCCDAEFCTKGGKHKHCRPNCPGTIHFSNPQHDLPATAETRAKNRAASDLFGMGEVSAEEMAAYREDGWWGGWTAEEDMHEAHKPILEQIREATPDRQAEVKKWREDRDLRPFPLPKAEFEEFVGWWGAPAAVDETPPDDEPPDEGEPRLITEAQSKKLHALMREHGVIGPARHDYLSALLDRPVDSVSDLTVAEASAAIDTIESLPVPSEESA